MSTEAVAKLPAISVGKTEEPTMAAKTGTGATEKFGPPINPEEVPPPSHGARGGYTHEILATTAEISEEHDGYAIDYSILRDPRTVGTLENDDSYDGVVRLLFVAMGVWNMIRTIVWRLVKFNWRVVRNEVVYPILVLTRKMTESQAANAIGIQYVMGPKRGAWITDGVHPLVGEVRANVTTPGALDVIYASEIMLREVTSFREWVAKFHFRYPAGQAVRNRLKKTFYFIVQELEKQWEAGEREFMLVSLACGSAQAMIEAVLAFKELHPDVQIHVDLVDKAPAALRRAGKLAQARGIADIVELHNIGLPEFMAAHSDYVYSVVEMVGYLDYKTERRIVQLSHEVRRILKPSGVFIAAHILPTKWNFCLRWNQNWVSMRHKRTGLFHKLLHDAGFTDNSIDMYVEPREMHAIARCYK